MLSKGGTNLHLVNFTKMGEENLPEDFKVLLQKWTLNEKAKEAIRIISKGAPAQCTVPSDERLNFELFSKLPVLKLNILAK